MSREFKSLCVVNNINLLYMALQSISQIIFVGPQQVFLGVGDMTKL